MDAKEAGALIYTARLSPTDLLEAYGLKLRTDTGDRAHLLALAESLSEKNLQRAIGALEVLMD